MLTTLLTTPAADVPMLALASTVHLAAGALRNHRDNTGHAVSSLAFISGLLGVMPWLFTSYAGLAFGLIVQAAWFAACDRFVAAAPAAAPSTGAVAARPPVAGAAAAPAAAPARPAPAAPARPPAPAAARRPAPPAGPAGASPAARPKGFVSVSVLEVIDETPDIRTYRLTRPEGFEFEAGQFVALRLRTDGEELVRCYSISSAPAVRGYLEISVKRLGVVSNALHAMARAGSQLSIKAPAGAFRYPSGDDRPILLLGGGVGVTPLMSMLRHAVMTEPSRPVTLMYSVKREADIAFRQELTWLAARYSQVGVHVAVTDERVAFPLTRARIDATLIRTAAPDVAHSISLICGPKKMIDGMKAHLVSLGVPSNQIRFELFEAAVAASTRAGMDEAPVAQVARAAAPRAAAAAPAGFQVNATRSAKLMLVSPAQTLLEAAEDHGVEIPSLCRAGVCGVCRVLVTDGQVECSSAMLDDQDRASGVVLACSATVHGDAAIEA